MDGKYTNGSLDKANRWMCTPSRSTNPFILMRAKPYTAVEMKAADDSMFASSELEFSVRHKSASAAVTTA